jgi:hypothetical protein
MRCAFIRLNSWTRLIRNPIKGFEPTALRLT